MHMSKYTSNHLEEKVEVQFYVNSRSIHILSSVRFVQTQAEQSLDSNV